MIDKILAFDQASTCTGFCLFNKGKYMRHGIIDLHKTKDIDIRLKAMVLEIYKVVNEIQPDLIYIEETALQSNPKTLRSLAQLQGCIIGYGYANGIPVKIIKPTEWRKALKFKQGRIKRPELKKQAKEHVFIKYGLETTEDECEAVCICEAAFIIENKNS